MLFRTRDLLVRQRTQTINSVRGQLAEFGMIAAQGVASVEQLRQGVAEAQEMLPDQVVSMANLLFEQIATFNEKIAGLERDIRARTREQEQIVDRRADSTPIGALMRSYCVTVRG